MNTVENVADSKTGLNRAVLSSHSTDMHMLGSHYAQYMLERQGARVIRSSIGFIAFRIAEGECFIAECFVQKKSRRQGGLRFLMDDLAKIARSSNCQFITGNIFLADPNVNGTLAAALALGFKLNQANNGCIGIMKNLGGK